MIKKLIMVPVLSALALSACGAGGAATTPTPAVTDTLPASAPGAIATTALPAMTETFTPEGTPLTATPTLGTIAPTNPPDCTNSAAFVADITIPDDTNVGASTVFTKTWRIANNGTCVWGPDYRLAYYSEERMAAPESVPLPITYPGANVDISVNLTAPSATGRHQANFVVKGPRDSILKIGDDSRLWVVINVTAGGAVASPTTGAATAAVTATFAPAATISVATLSVATTVSTVPAATTGSSGSGTTSCLYSIDRTKLMEVINAVNAYRAEKSLPAFTIHPRLAQAAQKHAGDMACNKLSGHTGSDSSTPQARVSAAGYTAASVAENVYVSSPPFTGQGVVNFWITDTADANNNKNLLSTTFTEIGVGYAAFNNSGSYVIVFAR